VKDESPRATTTTSSHPRCNNFRLGQIEAELSRRAPLAQQVPALAQLHLHRLQTLVLAFRKRGLLKSWCSSATRR